MSVQLDRAATSCADLAFMEAEGTTTMRLRVALYAYHWAIENRRPFGTTDIGPETTLFAYPSLDEWRAENARIEGGEFWAPRTNCDNYRPPLTCLTAPSSEAGRCDACRATTPADLPPDVARSRVPGGDGGGDRG